MTAGISKGFAVILLLGLLFGCYPLVGHVVTPTTSSGLFTQLGSTAPSFGPVFVGMMRQEAERYLGVPYMTSVIDENHYFALYKYESERSASEIIATDALDVVTFGLGTYMVSPVDRFNGRRHLMGLTYAVEDKHGTRDRVIAIRDRMTDMFSVMAAGL